MKRYNLNVAEQLLNNFIGLSGFDITDKSRKEEKVCKRSFFNYLLHRTNNMNPSNIEDFYKEKGGTLTRLSIRHSLDRYDYYYENFEQFRKYYDNYFIGSEEQKKLNKKREVKSKAEFKQDELFNVINGLKEDWQRTEMLEMVNLRIKSWEWKYSDKCEIISCSDGITSLTF